MTNVAAVAVVMTAVVTVAALLWSTLLLAACVAVAGAMLSAALWYAQGHPPRVA